MADKPDDTQPGDDPKGGAPAPDSVEFWQQKAKDAEARANKVADDLAAFRKQIEDKDKTEQQRLNDALTDAQNAANAARADALRYKIGLQHNLPAAWIPRLQGATEDELAADAAELAKSLPPTGGQQPPKGPTKPLGPLQPGGANPPTDEPTAVDGNDVIRQMFAAKTTP